MMEYISIFVFVYPMMMAIVWIFGSLIFRFFVKEEIMFPPFAKGAIPGLSILVPCHNEEDCIEETVLRLMVLELEQYEVILINDFSQDSTLDKMIELQQKFPESNIRIVNLKTNQGKGAGMTIAAKVARYEYLLGIDADAVLDKWAPQYLLWHLVRHPDLGAVTGNPKVRNRISILAKIQVGEFSSIIGMIKRTQRLFGVVYTVSGVVALFRKRAVVDVGMWSNDMVTEDIDITWKLQLKGWGVQFEPRALCWILVPETLKGIWSQRLRWSQGGNEVLLKYWKDIFSFRSYKMWILYLEYSCSVFWCYAFLFTIIITICEGSASTLFKPELLGLLSLICLVQFSTGLILDNRYEKSQYKNIPWLVLYPLAYWIVNMSVTVVSFPKALLKPKGKVATWKSPDRGIRNE
jgi:poly-beta-1,6-N-acetyl-D-glucosamine synthase